MEIKADNNRVPTGVHCNINESLALWTQKALQTNEQVSDNYLYESGIECENFQGRLHN